MREMLIAGMGVGYPHSVRVKPRFITALLALPAAACALVGAGAAAAYEVTPSPTAVNFGTVTPGVATSAQTVTFTNPFYNPTPPSVSWNLATPAVVISGADASDFSVTTDCLSLLNASCTAQVTMTPTAVGHRDATVELIQSTGTVLSASTLTGTAIASPSVITASQSGFANPTVGTATTGVVTFTNASSVAIPLGAASIAGSSALTLPAGGVNTCSGATLPAGGQCGVQVSFLPTTAGTATATVSLASTGLSGPATGAVSVTASTPVPALPFYPGNVPICHSGNGKNYVSNRPSYRSIVGGTGHGGHANDIIPAFNYPGGTYLGKNWPPSGHAASASCVRALIAGSTRPASTQLRPPNPPVQQTVTLCHATGPGTWTKTSVPADQAYAVHGRHRQDIIPPFTLRTASGNVAFPGQNWDRDGQLIWQNGCRTPAMVSTLTPTDSVTICSVPTDGQYARLTLSIPNALAYARTYPTAIIPPFSYRDGSSTRRFQGLNWSSRGKATFNNGCVDPDPPVQRITPSVQCVQVATDGTLTAYFDVSNPNGSTIAVAPGAGNQVTGSGFTAPTPPGAFAPGTGPRVLAVTGIPRAGSATWSITAGGVTSTAVASGLSPACAVPPEPPKQIGVFVSCIRSEGSTYGVVFGYENGGTTPVMIPAGTDNGVVLSSESTTDAPNRGQVTTFAPGRNPSAFEVKGVPRGTTISWIVAVAPIAPGTDLAQATRVAGATVPDGAPACATTPPTSTTVPPTTGPQPPDLTSLVPIGVQVTCVRKNGNGSFDAIFGYSNANPVAITAPIGPLNQVTPSLGGTGDDQGQVQEFLPGSLDNAWVARGVPVTGTVTWRVGGGGGAVATAGIGSPACPGSTTVTPGKPPTNPLVPTQTPTSKDALQIGVFVQCVRRTGRTYTASFGYEMTGPAPAGISRGKDNRIGPSAFDGPQPVMFTPGRHDAVFTVEKIPLKRAVTWIVRNPDGTTATARSSASGPNCMVSRQPAIPAVDVTVTPTTGPTITGRPQPQPIVVKNTGTATATDVVAVVPPAPGQVIRTTSATGTGDARCSRTTGKGVIRVANLLPGQAARCVLTVTATRCDPLATTVRASASSLRLTGAIQSRTGGVGGRTSCRAAGSGVTG